ncbi:MAG TPA: hypothetical protein VMW83_11150 [Spirochaetia bacterium]|nr:hypothetical protein [Spirochaetia bacterium]
MSIGIYAVFGQLYTVLQMTGQQAAILTIAVAGGQFIVLLFGLYYLLSTFYYAGDLQHLLPLPLRPRDIIGAKLVLVLAGEYLTVFPLVAPILVLYGVRGATGWLYWPLALAVYLVLPVLPLAVSAIIIFPLMRFTAGAKNREAFRVAGSLLAALVYLVVRFAVASPGGPVSGRQVQPWLRIGHALSGVSWAAFLPQQWAAAALALTSPGGALAHFLLFAALSALLLVIALLLAGKWFFRGIAGGHGAGRGRRGQGKTVSKAAFKSRSPLMALVLKETRVFFRTPMFLLNGLTSSFLLPLMFLIGFGGRGWRPIPLDSPQSSMVAVLIAAGVIVLTTGLSPVSATAVSREGKAFWISKHLPLSGREQMSAKLIHSLIFPLVAAIVITFFLLLVTKVPVWAAVPALFLGLAGSVPAAEAGLIIDLLHPNLEWSDPQRAIKGFNGIFALLTTIVMLGIAAAAAVALVISGAWPVVVPVIILLLFLLLGVVLYRVLGSLAAKRYPEV